MNDEEIYVMCADAWRKLDGTVVRYHRHHGNSGLSPTREAITHLCEVISERRARGLNTAGAEFYPTALDIEDTQPVRPLPMFLVEQAGEPRERRRERPWEHGWANFTFVSGGLRYEIEPLLSVIRDVWTDEVREVRYTDDWRCVFGGAS